MKKAKILYVANDYDFFIAHRMPFALEAQKKGYDVCFSTPPPANGHHDETRFPDIEFYPLKLKRKGRMIFTELKSISHLMLLYKQVKPDIVHHFTIKPVVYGSFVAKLTDVPVIINTITGLGSIYIQPNFVNWITQFFIGLTYKFSFRNERVKLIFQNPDDQKLFLERNYIKENQSCVVLGSGVDTQKFTPTDEPSSLPTILYPGRMLWDKGVGDLIEAGKSLREKGYRFVIRFCGPLDMLNPTGIKKKDILKWQEYDWFAWDGPQSDMPTVFSESHIVCLPSYREGVPIALLEAAASCRPIVTTLAPGCREVVNEEQNGYLVPVSSPESIAMAIAKLLERPEMRKVMGQEGRKIATAQFSREETIEEVLGVYRSMVNTY
ncbi:MAG: glycosyltransferase family 4 protein, partial [Bdellovibrionales bacterium]|nr:glycosyltransferase family 4 protein [Bdellovibrionales bacterium]NQZ19110.1 glycosyltransferase family 4 protein [Bdellovibrionales bacterium]